VKTKELRALSQDKLKTELKNSRLELMKFKGKRALGTVEKPTLVRTARKNVARILTILNEKKVKKSGR